MNGGQFLAQLKTNIGDLIFLLTMKETGGSIINMSSRSGLVGVPSTSAYASSKAAVRNYTKCVALYCAEKGYNIRCNSLHPAAILTPIWDAMIGKEKEERKKNIESLKAGIPLGFMGTPLDVAYAVLYLGVTNRAILLELKSSWMAVFLRAVVQVRKRQENKRTRDSNC
jgi:NAD(P)-dependent dehydrogenase (short-subunit alcohol dehydrogenase family)